MGRTAQQGLSKHATKGYRISIGKKPDGDYRTFWLGHNRAIADYYADTLRGQFESMRLQGRDVWTDADLAEVQKYLNSFKGAMLAARQLHARDLARVDERRKVVEQQGEIVQQQGKLLDAFMGDAPASESAAPLADSTSSKPRMLYEAVAAYLANLRGKRKADSHKRRADQVLNINLKAARPDCPLSNIDYAWIDGLCDYFKARPPSLKNKKTPIGANTVKVILQYLRQFFVWLDDTSYGDWEGPRKLMKPFRVRTETLLTPAELRETGTIKQFDIPTLRKLYTAASNRQKTLMLTALFTGATQIELAVLEKSEFDLAAGTLNHFRNKTRVEGRFWLPSELVKLLKAEFKERPSDKLAFRTRDGLALVTYQDGKLISDAVRQTWDDLRVAAEVPDALSFKYLRKFMADWMTRHGGEQMGQIALSHSRRTVLAKHYTTARDFETFNALQRKMHKELKAAKFFEAEKNEATAA